MASLKISQLPAAAPLAGGELLAGVQSAGDVAITPRQIATYIGSDTLVNLNANFHPTLAPLFLQTTGYAAPGDLGAALYVKVASQPAHMGRLSITLADGTTVVWYSLTTDTVRPEMFGRTDHHATDSTSATNNTTAIQNALNYFQSVNTGANCGRVLMASYAINGTINVTGGVIIEGTGWGSTLVTTVPTSYLRWVGTSGIPMMFIQNQWGCTVKKLRFMGNSASKPSCAIEMSTVSGLTDSIYNRLEDIWIGQFYGFDTDIATQFTRGILFSGTLNENSHILSNISINNCDQEGVYVQNPNAALLYIINLNINFCSIAIRTAAQINIDTMFAGNIPIVFQLETVGKITCCGSAFENCGQLLLVNGNDTKFVMRDTSFQTQTPAFNAGGLLLDVGSTLDWHIDLENCSVQGSGSNPPVVSLRLYNVSGGLTLGYFRCIGCDNIFPSNLNFGTVIGTNDARNVEYVCKTVVGQDLPPPHQKFMGSFTQVADRTFQVWRNDFAGKLNIFGGQLNVRQLIVPPFPSVAALLGSGATTYSYRITALTYEGETQASSAFTCTNAVALSAGVATNKVSWGQVLGAYAYNIYGRTSGTEQLITTITYDSLHGGGGLVNKIPPFWVDDGSLSPSGAFPTINTTGSASVDGPLLVGTRTPASAAASGTVGQITWDSGFLYVCTAANTWKRVAIATW